MKHCPRCKVTKELSEFSHNGRYKDKRHPICRKCYLEYQKEWYQKNKEKHIERARRSNSKRIGQNYLNIMDYLSLHPCVDCQEPDPIVLEFHHLREKEMNVMKMVWQAYSWEKILAEIQKCIVLCANCHRRRTYGNSKSIKFLGV